ncbi:MAG: electron transfer flavoprotein-ubiquinone oxidoreductase [Acidobacteriota bacterium]
MDSNRESLEVDVLFVGAGPASLCGAILLRRLAENDSSGRLKDITIAVIEKGREIGSHTLSGAILDPRALRELFPDFAERGAPLGVPVEQDALYFLTARRQFRFPLIPPAFRNEGNYIISLSRLVKWLGEQAEEVGIEIFPGFAGTDLLFDGDRLIGVRTGDRGIDREKRPKRAYEPGVDILAKVVVLGEGVRGSLTKQLLQRFGLDQGRNPQVYAIGVKEVWELPDETSTSGTVIHSFGYPLGSDTYGGGFLYQMGRFVSVGLVVGLDYRNPFLDPHLEFQRFKTHPLIRSFIRNAKLACYGAKAIPEGGYFSIPQTSCHGGLIVGDGAGLVNPQRLKGIHLGMKSGMLAAETIFQALQQGDLSAETLGRFGDLLQSSWVGEELRRVRNFRQAFDHGLIPGILRTGLQMITGGRDYRDRLPSRAGHERMERAASYAGEENGTTAFQPDGNLTFDKLTNVYYSGTKHEEDQPAHLLIAQPDICSTRCVQEYANPCQRFCPANVYEIVSADDGQAKQLQLNPSNCVHCKTCDIMDPYQIITWVPPEGGGGPNYINT